MQSSRDERRPRQEGGGNEGPHGVTVRQREECWRYKRAKGRWMEGPQMEQEEPGRRKSQKRGRGVGVVQVPWCPGAV